MCARRNGPRALIAPIDSGLASRTMEFVIRGNHLEGETDDDIYFSQLTSLPPAPSTLTNFTLEMEITR